ncbi:hypothetical protein K438DRAFT_1824550 [Mycena galopus ATCC 62051]|nr:hypothetical protein K438DRAFT_1824550 [Mycena galopus ATCC 62051]
MFFTRALFVSISLASLVIPGTLASPASNDVGVEARANTAAVLSAGQTVLTNIHNVVDKANELKAANPTAYGPAISQVKSVLVGTNGVLPSNGYLGSSGGGALNGCLGGSSSSYNGIGLLGGLLGPGGLGQLLSGVVNLLDEILGGLLGGLLSPLLYDVSELLNSILGCRSACGCGSEYDGLLQELITLVDVLLLSLSDVTSASHGCGCGYDDAVLQGLGPDVIVALNLVIAL